jgi:hypothetical protein
MAERRECTNSPAKQGKDEDITRYIDFANWGASSVNPVTNQAVYVYDEDGTDVSSTHAGTPTVQNDTEIHCKLKDFVAGHTYRVEYYGTFAGDNWEAWFSLIAEE